MKEFTNDQVREYWDVQAKSIDDKSLATHRDKQQRIWEIDIISSLLRQDDVVLDVGCGNGYATVVFAKLVERILGIDYLASMIERAKNESPDLPNASFDVQDVLNLKTDRDAYDVVISARCLINLDSWEAQQKGIENIASTLKSGGRYIMCEGSIQGRSAVNAWRTDGGLEPMPPVQFNLDFDETKLWDFLASIFEIEKIFWSGNFDFVSRVVHPLFVHPEPPDYGSRLNEVARVLADKIDSGFNDTGREFIAVLKKK